jgi:hypothetical protein
MSGRSMGTWRIFHELLVQGQSRTPIKKRRH